jgi:ribosomal protein L35AE/L33A
MKETNRKKKTMIRKKKTMIKVDVRSKDCLYITIGKWVIYIDNSTGEQIIDSWEE